MNMSNYFDVYDIFINELIGSVWLAAFIGAIFIFYKSAQSGFPFQVTMIFEVVWACIMFSIAFQTMLLLYIMAGLAVAGFFYYTISKRMRQG